MERSFFYLNVDVCHWKFVQKWERYGRLKLDMSTLPGSVGQGLCLLASMPTQNIIGGWAMKRVGSKLSTRKRTSFVAAQQANNEHVLSCCAHCAPYRAFGLITFEFEELLRRGFCDQIRNGETFSKVCLSLWSIGPVVAHIIMVFWSCQTNLVLCIEGFFFFQNSKGIMPLSM